MGIKVPIFGSASIVNEDIIYIQVLAISNIFLNILYPVYRSNHLNQDFLCYGNRFQKRIVIYSYAQLYVKLRGLMGWSKTTYFY